MDDDGSCADGTFDARYGYDLDGNRLWARLHDGQTETVVVQIEGLADWTRGSHDAQIHVVAFGRRVATKYLESAVALAAPSYVPGTKVPLEPGWLLIIVAFAGGLWLLVVAVRDGVPARMAERPAAAVVVILVSGLLIAPPPAWAGGGGGGGGGTQVYRRWLFHDHLGTNVLVTNVNGAVIRRRLFEPFGKLLNEQTSTEPHDRLFTGQRYEESTDLYDFQQRWYDAETGRFTGVDPVIPNAWDPQSVNGYGYAGNNPLRFTDPDGRTPFGDLLESGIRVINGSAGKHVSLFASLLGGATDLNASGLGNLPALTVLGEWGGVPLSFGSFGAFGGTLSPVSFRSGNMRAQEAPSPARDLVGFMVTSFLILVYLVNAGQHMMQGDSGDNPHEPREDKAEETEPDVPPYNDDPTASPGEGWEWRGPPGSTPGSGEGAWWNKGAGGRGRSVRPHRGPNPHGPHNDISDRETGRGWWQYPDGRLEPKP